MFLDPAGLRLQLTSTHLSKYWSNGGSSSLPEMVKWHACLWEGRQRGGDKDKLLERNMWQVSPPAEFHPSPSKALEPREGTRDLKTRGRRWEHCPEWRGGCSRPHAASPPQAGGLGFCPPLPGHLPWSTTECPLPTFLVQTWPVRGVTRQDLPTPLSCADGGFLLEGPGASLL